MNTHTHIDTMHIHIYIYIYIFNLTPPELMMKSSTATPWAGPPSCVSRICTVMGLVGVMQCFVRKYHIGAHTFT
jgi:hypothetical protein